MACDSISDHAKNSTPVSTTRVALSASNPMPATDKTLRLYGTDRRMFFEQSMYPLVKQPYYLQLRRLYREVQKGNARWNGYTYRAPPVVYATPYNYGYQAPPVYYDNTPGLSIRS